MLPNDVIAYPWDRFVSRRELWDASRKLRGAPRSDITLPFAAWRGRHGVDWQRARSIFAIPAPTSRSPGATRPASAKSGGRGRPRTR